MRITFDKEEGLFDKVCILKNILRDIRNNHRKYLNGYAELEFQEKHDAYLMEMVLIDNEYICYEIREREKDSRWGKDSLTIWVKWNKVDDGKRTVEKMKMG